MAESDPARAKTVQTLSIEGRTLVGEGIKDERFANGDSQSLNSARGSLAWLLHPLNLDSFLEKYWGTRHHVIHRNAPQYFQGLLDAAAIESYMEFARPNRSEIALIRRAEEKRLEAFRLGDERIDLVRIKNYFAEGYTIILNGLENHVLAIASLAREIETELNFDVVANAYVTPPRSQGFLPHYDDHDVFILQLEGSKNWQVYDSVEDVPNHELRLKKRFVGGDLPAPTYVKLQAGDLLYLPRGRVHAASAEEETSIHLTVGIHPPNVLMLANAVLEALSYRDDRLLNRLPPRFLKAPAARAELAAVVREAVDLIDEEALADGLGALEDKLVRRGRCEPAAQFIANASCPPSTSKTRVRKSRGLYTRVLATGADAVLQFSQSLVTAAADHRDAMLFISEANEPFEASQLPGLTADQQIELVRKLVTDGLLVRVGED